MRPMRPQRAAPEQLPPAIDVVALANQHGLTLGEATELLRIQEWRGNAYSRIDPETGMVKWYWRR